MSTPDLGKQTAIFSKRMLEDHVEDSDRFYTELKAKIAYIHYYHVKI